MIASSEIRVFQSRGEAGRDHAPIRVLICSCVASRVVTASFARRAFHSVADIFDNHARTLAILSLGASKRFG
jgi:hypothetical protein